MNELVSIVVPVYNVEPYIRRAVDSLLAQTYTNIEVILVDDGSPDRCGAICDEYAARDNRIKVIHQANGGVSRARQAGLDAATGEYVLQVDPDDYVEPNMVEELLRKAIETGADMVTCDYYQNDRVCRQDYGDAERCIWKCLNWQAALYLWNALISRDFIQRHNISFTPDWLPRNEDFLFLMRVLGAGAKIDHIHKPLYHYISRMGSAVSRRSKKHLQSVMTCVKELYSIFDAKKYEDFFMVKRNIFVYAYESRMFHEVNTIFPEIRERLRHNADGNIHSIDSQLARCMIYPPPTCLDYQQDLQGVMAKIKPVAGRLKRGIPSLKNQLDENSKSGCPLCA